MPATVAARPAPGVIVAKDYRVVYRGRVAVRSSRSLWGEMVGTQRCGDIVRAVAIHGHWLRLAPEECKRLHVGEAWMLMNGQRQGFGQLLEPFTEKEAALEVAQKQAPPNSSTNDWVLSVGLEDEFEECIDIHWRLEAAPGVEKRPGELKKAVIEMVIDRSDPNSKAPLKPPKDAMVKRVPGEEGKDQAQLVMPSGRRFLVAVVGSLADGTEVRSDWIQAKTLSERTREKGFGSVDPVGKTRLACLVCSCSGYIMTKWSSNSRNKGRCRRCGCGFENHQVGSSTRLSMDALEELVEQYKQEIRVDNPFKEPPPLPDDATLWSPQEVDLYLRTEGDFHPRRTKGEHRSSAPSQGSTRLAGKPGRVSVIVPTTDARQSFHSSLWACFEAQTWEDKELVVVETYTSSPSTFLSKKARKDQRLTYVAFKRPPDKDWSIGLKRNICAQLSTGEFIAHFDDDDLYAPAYLSTLLQALESPKVQGVKLASWFIFDKERGVFAHCDPVECGKQEGKDENTDQWIRKWLYGYGFSYLYRRQAAMECPYRDLNLGEDFEFFSSLQEMKGRDSIVLQADGTGLCVHLQHGGNTSDTQHLVDRLLSREEVSDLEVADLRPVFDEYMRRFPKKRVGVDKDKAQPKAPVERRLRSVVVHTAHGNVDVECWAGATAAELLQQMEERVGMMPLRSEVFWVPPPDQASEADRLRCAASLLRLDGADLAAVEKAESVDDLCPELSKLVRSYIDAVPYSERIGARTLEVWVRLPQMSEGGRSGDHVRVTTDQEKLAPKSVSRVFHVHLADDAKVVDLRNALGTGLPKTAVVYKLKGTDGGGGTSWVSLGDWEAVPDKVRVSDFVEQVTADMVLRHGNCLEVYYRMYGMLVQQDVQDLLMQMKAESEGQEYVFKALLLQFLSEKIYPAIAPYFGILDGNDFFNSFVRAIGVHMNSDWDLSLHKAWLEVEKAMHNEAQTATALMWIEAGGVWNIGGTR